MSFGISTSNNTGITKIYAKKEALLSLTFTGLSDLHIIPMDRLPWPTAKSKRWWKRLQPRWCSGGRKMTHNPRSNFCHRFPGWYSGRRCSSSSCQEGSGLVPQQLLKLLGEGHMTRWQPQPLADWKSLGDRQGGAQQDEARDLREDSHPGCLSAVATDQGREPWQPDVYHARVYAGVCLTAWGLYRKINPEPISFSFCFSQGEMTAPYQFWDSLYIQKSLWCCCSHSFWEINMKLSGYHETISTYDA